MAKNMLIVDDEPLIGAMLSRSARQCAFDVVATTEPSVFRAEYLKRRQDVIVLDLQMPENDGVELIRFLADQHCRATIVVASGLERRLVETTVRLGSELGLTMGPVLLKPFRGSTVSSLFQELGETDAQGPDAPRRGAHGCSAHG
jgi:DNA-binding response OmpR family regulator